MNEGRTRWPLLFSALLVVLLGLAICAVRSTGAALPAVVPAAEGPVPTRPRAGTSLSRAYQHLVEVMDQYHLAFDVYTDVGSAGNHFVHRAQMGTDVTLNDAFTETVHSGCTAIENRFSPGSPASWGGWYFQNGVLLAGDVKPRDNWGEHPGAGLDLTGATRLTF